MRRLYGYKATAAQTVDNVATRLRMLTATIAEINLEAAPKDIVLALILMNSIDAEAYTMAKALLEDKENITFIGVIEKLKEVEQRKRDDIVAVDEVAAKTSNSKFSGECYHCHIKGHKKNTYRQ